MIEIAVLVFLGLLGGVAVGTQGAIAGGMSQKVGGAASSVIIHASGLVASLILLFARGGEQISEWRTLPWYMLGAGVFGLILYLTLSQTIPKLGATAAITLLIVGQLTATIVIDHFGVFDTPVRQLDWQRAFAVVLLVTGAVLVVR